MFSFLSERSSSVKTVPIGSRTTSSAVVCGAVRTRTPDAVVILIAGCVFCVNADTSTTQNNAEIKMTEQKKSRIFFFMGIPLTDCRQLDAFHAKKGTEVFEKKPLFPS